MSLITSEIRHHHTNVWVDRIDDMVDFRNLVSAVKTVKLRRLVISLLGFCFQNSPSSFSFSFFEDGMGDVGMELLCDAFIVNNTIKFLGVARMEISFKT